MSIASGIAYWSQEDSPFFPTFISYLGILGILSMILGGMAVASSPGRMVSRGEISHTHVHDLKLMRQGYSPWLCRSLIVSVRNVDCCSCFHVVGRLIKTSNSAPEETIEKHSHYLL